MLRTYRFAGSPRWLVGHLVVLALVVTMVLLGRWQLDVSDAKHFALQNFGYAVQWWAFSLFGVLFWLKIVRDTARHARAPQSAEPGATACEPVAYRRYVMPQSADAPAHAVDSEQAAYNEYLAQLAERGRQG